MRVITFKIDEELLTKLDLYCINNRLYRSEVIRDAIELYLSMSHKGRVYRKNKNLIEENYRNEKLRVQEL
ncbi:ribbon-helix-helix protein, CopG family [Saccharolobus shibatae]|uniref:ribbon-helix-helix protein, CopG family n=1 Tax=Saccharolobus shibatae TaxID=2286 RepID=UPI001C496039|nr:ribbon-helix-helix protein, CopG family [Saccharolobus shibatae]